MLKANRFEKCPQCGGEKRKLVACSNCGYSFIAAKGLVPKKKSKKNKKPSVQNNNEKGSSGKKREVSKPRLESKRNKIIRPFPSGELPDYDQSRSRNDVFDTGRVVSGGSFESGKNRKH